MKPAWNAGSGGSQIAWPEISCNNTALYNHLRLKFLSCLRWWCRQRHGLKFVSRAFSQSENRVPVDKAELGGIRHFLPKAAMESVTSDILISNPCSSLHTCRPRLTVLPSRDEIAGQNACSRRPTTRASVFRAVRLTYSVPALDSSNANIVGGGSRCQRLVCDFMSPQDL